MQLLSDDVAAIVQEVWSSMLGLDIEPIGETEGVTGQAIAGSVGVTGASDCLIALEMTVDTAKLVGATMFMMGLDEVSMGDVTDAVGELTNMIGGNIKSLLPEPSTLSLPVVAQGEPPTMKVIGGETILAQGFACGDGRVSVTVWNRQVK
ncbi:chemotaxis protein CheX [Dermatophilus congolensis]|uniref:Chemotaxis phosphatase CheX-like domain-containing protein n=1 Tax=Dermatophilus congolensis TaxID=1863 RepID=A0A239VU93_9MICO|nr:chemotaxis protein CheX [Dermatophilus congolensis]MBO3130009.1 chemotaxis protein CheX [Dermatophilus congolensis]MBO3131361.1 chemotaxis protein CheX [Dermatophilus congolensis]MBO3134483.1 chemotaxis protein CheX [Dermatophilus congolensis]MBO3136718.1 chemotaxis protein CheX [Dermatophilus congolensis]MBO3138963.1 chemotaxis protein CheX [Dermatophilus congolensis]